MTDRMTRQRLEDRVSNLNRRMEDRGSAIRYVLEGRNGATALDRVTKDPAATINLPDSVPGRGYGWVTLDLVLIGTKAEVGDYLRAAMLTLDDAERKA